MVECERAFDYLGVRLARFTESVGSGAWAGSPQGAILGATRPTGWTPPAVGPHRLLHSSVNQPGTEFWTSAQPWLPRRPPGSFIPPKFGA